MNVYRSEGVIAIRGLLSDKLMAALNPASQQLVKEQQERDTQCGYRRRPSTQFHTVQLGPSFVLDDIKPPTVQKLIKWPEVRRPFHEMVLKMRRTCLSIVEVQEHAIWREHLLRWIANWKQIWEVIKSMEETLFFMIGGFSWSLQKSDRERNNNKPERVTK